MKILRFIAMLVVNNIPCGRLAPYLFGFGIGRVPHNQHYRR